MTYGLKNLRCILLMVDPLGNAKWILNVSWEMQGIDVHLDPNIGKQLSALGHTLTAIAGESEEYQEHTFDETDAGDNNEFDCEATDTEVSSTVGVCFLFNQSIFSLPSPIFPINPPTISPQEFIWPCSTCPFLTVDQFVFM